MIHALDKDTGETLWETELDANPDGIPAIYEVAGRQYIAFYGAVSGAPESIAYNPENLERKATTCSLCRRRIPRRINRSIAEHFMWARGRNV